MLCRAALRCAVLRCAVTYAVMLGRAWCNCGGNWSMDCSLDPAPSGPEGQSLSARSRCPQSADLRTQHIPAARPSCQQCRTAGQSGNPPGCFCTIVHSFSTWSCIAVWGALPKAHMAWLQALCVCVRCSSTAGSVFERSQPTAKCLLLPACASASLLL